MNHKKIVFFSDSLRTISLYREALIEELSLRYEVKRYAIDTLLALRIRHTPRSCVVVVSNLRASVLSLVIFPLYKKIFILNGLGRYRNVKIVRRLLLALLRVNKKTDIVCQNYADYKYFKKYSNNVHFILGSGGKTFPKKDATTDKWLLVTRSSKIDIQKSSILAFGENSKNKLVAFGVDEAETSLNLETRGFVERCEIFASGTKFFHPGGYGEGFPHALADAIANRMSIAIGLRDFVMFGLYRVQKEYEKEESFVYFIPSKELIRSVLEDGVNEQYARLIEEKIKEI